MASKQEVYQWWINRGYQPHEAAALTGNFVAESGLDPTVYNKQGSGAFGTGQWLGSRKRDLLNFAKSEGKDPNDITTQLEFADFELHGKEANALKKLQATKNVNDATYAVAKYYERPSDKEIAGSIAKRTKVAQSLLGSEGEGSSGGAGGLSSDLSEEKVQRIQAYRKAKESNPNLTVADFKATSPLYSSTKPTISEPTIDEDKVAKVLAYRAAKAQNPNLTTAEFKATSPLYKKDVATTTPTEVEPTPASNPVGFTANSANKALANVGDSIINAPENLASIGVAGLGVLAGELGVPTKYLPEIKAPEPKVTNLLKSWNIISDAPEVNPTSTAGKVADAAIQGAVGYATLPVGGVANVGKNLLTGATMGGTASAVTEATDNPLLGTAVGVVAPAVITRGASLAANSAVAKGAGKVAKALADEVPYYSKAGAEKAAAKNIHESFSTRATAMGEAAPTPMQSLETLNKVKAGEITITPQMQAEMTKAPDTIVHNNPEIVSSAAGAGLVSAVSGSPLGGAVAGYLFKGAAKKVVDGFTARQNQALQDAVNKGITNPETLQKAFAKMQPREVETFMQKLENLNTPVSQARIGMALPNEDKDKKPVNKLTGN